jgi:hypothetical protein
VQALLSRGDERYVAVERGTPPLTHDVRAVPWSDVAGVDHEALAVRLRLDAAAIDSALELDPGKGVETEDAEARRVTELPAELSRSVATGESAGPVDRPTYAVALALGFLGIFAVLVLALAATERDFTWEFALFVLPVALLGGALLAAYRAFRNPYERR